MQKNTTQLHDVTPEQLKKEIVAAVKNLIEDYIKNNKKEELLTREEAASFLHISLPTLNSYVKRGLIEELRLGKRVYYNKEDLLKSFVYTNKKK